jgi:hypothetical protein
MWLSGPHSPFRRFSVVAVLAVTVAEILIFVPSIANFQLLWLKHRQAGARAAAVAIAAIPPGAKQDDLLLQILLAVDAKAIAIRTRQARSLLATTHQLPTVTRNLDVRDASIVRVVVDSFTTLLSDNDEFIRVIGPAPMGDEFLESIVESKLLRKAMWRFSRALLVPLLITTAVTATLTSRVGLISRGCRIAILTCEAGTR